MAVHPDRDLTLALDGGADAWLGPSRLIERIDPTGLLAPELRQSLLLTTFVLYARAHEFVLDGRAPSHDSAPPIEPAALRGLTSLSEGTQEAALIGLRRAGILRASGSVVALAEGIVQPDPQRGRVRWDRVLQGLAGDASGLLVAWAFGLHLTPPGAYVPVAARELEDATGLSGNTVRQAQRRLVNTGVLDRQDIRPGGTPQFAFTPYALGGAAPDRIASGSPAPASTHRREIASRPGGTEVTIGQVRLRLPEEGPPIDLELTYDADGRPVWRGPGLEVRPA